MAALGMELAWEGTASKAEQQLIWFEVRECGMPSSDCAKLETAEESTVSGMTCCYLGGQRVQCCHHLG